MRRCSRFAPLLWVTTLLAACHDAPPGPEAFALRSPGVVSCAGRDCDDGNVCTADGCVGESGCTHTPLSEGPCDDGSPCTRMDACASGACRAGHEVLFTTVHGVAGADIANGVVALADGGAIVAGSLGASGVSLGTA
jgi:hypothetical protein